MIKQLFFSILFATLALQTTYAKTVDYWTSTDAGHFGSLSVLNSCWRVDELRGKTSEKATRKRGPGAILNAPERTIPKITLKDLPKYLHNSIRSVNTKGEKIIALTFDIGEQNNDFAGYDGQIIDYLRDNNIKATLYLGGKWMATHSERAMQLIADPNFEIGNHAWTHGNLRVLRGQDIIDQIQFTQAQYEVLLEELYNRDCAKALPRKDIPPAIATFRYPYGTCNAASIRVVNNLGLPTVQWNLVTGDPSKGQSAKRIARYNQSAAKPGSIIVMHANGRGWNTGAALPMALPNLRNKGFRFVTISELLKMGTVKSVTTCYELRLGDNTHYDRIFGKGTGD